ncbi:MAG: hypothetical protein QXH85_05660 [Candidatus Bathyarchaeia archaeon]
MPFGLVSALLGLIGGAFGFAMSLQPIHRQIAYGLNTLIPNLELDVETAITAYFRGLITLDDLKVRLKRHGISEENTITLLNISKRIFTIEQAIYAYRRGFISNEELKKILNANRVPENEHELYLKITEYFPSPSDIIRFAAREVFTPEIIEKYRMAEELPSEYIELTKQAGIPELLAKWYWYAHWELPSLTMGFEMFRRKIITADELKTLMRTLNIMPGWRDKLIELAYDIPTRVDVRRMYAIGVLTRDQVKEYYEKMGYKPEDAELLTRWTEIEYAAEDRTLTVKQILELYELGEFNREEAIEYLRKLGYPQEIAEYKITLYEHERLLKDAKEQLNLLIEQYKSGIITLDELIDEAYKLPFSPTTIKRALIKAYREKEAKTKLPSLNTLKKWLKLGIISVEQFKDYLLRMGYRDEDVENYIKEVTQVPIEQLQSMGD